MKKLLTVTFFTGLLTLFRMGTGFLVSKIIAVQAGPSGLALLAQIQNLATVLNGVVGASSSIALVRYTSENISGGYKQCTPWWRASLKCTLFLLAIFVPLGVIFSNYIAVWLFSDVSYSTYIRIICCLLPFSVLGTALNSVINGQQFYKKYILLGGVSVSIATLIMISMIYLYGIKGALAAASVQLGIIGIVSLLICIKEPWVRIKFWLGKTTKNHVNGIIGYMAMALISVISMPLSLMAIRYSMAKHLGWDITGEWQLVWKISEVYLSVLTISLSTYYLPRLSKLKTYDDILKEVNKTAFFIFPVVVFLAVLVYFSRDLIINLLFSSQFENARDLFLVQLSGDVIKIIGWLYAYPMIATGAKKWFIGSELFFCSTLFILSYIFMLKYGAQGVNLGYLVNYVFYILFVLLNLKNILPKNHI
ncbi:O-antigen translocase [Escherichia coli]|uniref:O-antigen translocase n=2 Tax=Escherichia coli TaxID=562 RepID=A0A8H2DAC2_ECOLX|nr:O-antigen translocase [Escherichia coli]EER8075249.1 O-antigen translocase [Escherichia coli]EFB6177530.1 O-antigen translocase [Escherichia coli]EFC5320312.1 O-antigen translocase [Escherichia coli]EGE8138077.1 O-antigen translocase [Escherichia coli]EGJ7834182.1 O-antigen translocase [Escherichia coli]